MGRNAIDRFWIKVEKTNNCWFWKGSTNPDGYGRFNVDGKLVGAHRFSYELHIGSIDNMHVLHRCDNPSCVNPEHLFLGSHSDNMKDMYRKKRHGNHKPCINHPDKLQFAKQLCRTCYMTTWKLKNPDKAQLYYKNWAIKNSVGNHKEIQ